MMKKYLKKIYKLNKEKLYKEVEKRLIEEKKTFIITANSEIMVNATNDKEIDEILLNKNNIIVPDGISVIKGAKFYKINIFERITGVDLTIKILELANKNKKSIYLFGAKKEVLIKLINKIKKQYQNVIIIGYSDGYVINKDKVFAEIRKKKPDIILVALGVPMQEKLIYKHLNNFNKGIFIGVGGTFDVLSGTKKRAPKLFIKLNLEWLYRLLKEPNRIKRFFQYNLVFFKIVIKDSKNEKRKLHKI